MLVRKAGPFAPSHSFSCTSMMSYPVCCSYGPQRGSQREVGATILGNSPDRQRATLHPILFPASFFLQNRSFFLSSPPSPSIFAPSRPLYLLPQTSLLNALLRPLFLLTIPQLFSSPFCCSIRHQLFFQGSVLFRAD